MGALFGQFMERERDKRKRLGWVNESLDYKHKIISNGFPSRWSKIQIKEGTVLWCKKEDLEKMREIGEIFSISWRLLGS